ncbi:MAG TPA: hypothetical protein VNZ03_12385 [Terriglobales bacterium]|nr:hypothetical protein [Terriglobales bacterium]
MKRVTLLLTVALFCLSSGLAQGPSTSQTVAIPHLVRFSGAVKDVAGQPLTGTLGITFALYRDQDSGAPLWLETQNVAVDNSGRYAVSLGATRADGLPVELFASGEARWLGVQPDGQAEQPRVLLFSVPYALKAADSETVGGLPASAFVLANGLQGNGTGTKAAAAPRSTTTPNSAGPPAHGAVTGKGVVDFIPMWDKTSDIVDSSIFQKSSQVGINTTAPAATFDVNGKSDIRDTLTLFPKGADSTLAVSGTAFKVDQTGKVNFISGQTFPGTGTITGVTTPSGSGLSGGGTSGTLNLSLLKTCSANQVLQWNGSSWACSSAGTGTITGVNTASGSGLQGGGTSGTLNLSVNAAVVPELAAANTFTNTNTVNANSGSPALTVENAAGDGIDIFPGAGSDGVYIPRNAGQYGIVAYGGSAEGGYFNGPVAGSYSVNTTDGNGSAAAYGQEFGSTQITYGVVGYSASNLGIGTYGQSVSASLDGAFFAGGGPLGVWGDSGAPDATGVLASVDSGNAIIAINNSDGLITAFFENEESSRNDDPVLAARGGVFGGQCSIDVSGDLFCTGSKSAVVPVDGGARKVALYAVESPENWFEDFGSGQLSNGAVTIALEPTFRQTVNTDTEYHVFLTPNGDSRGLYVTQKTVTSFEVREQGGGTSSIAFDYRIVARRKGYEQIRLADKTQLMNTPRPKRAQGPRSVMPTELGIGKAHEPSLRAARPTQLVVNKK